MFSIVATPDHPHPMPDRRPPAPNPAARSLVESVYARLTAGILSGALPSGTVLSEVELAKELGVSRTPVRDALRQLGKDGLVTQARNRRATVARFSPDDVFEIFELRKFLEGPAAELAAGRIDARALAPLRAAADALAAGPGAPDWTARWADFDDAFHVAVAEASGNRRLAADIGRYRLLHRGFNIGATDRAALQGPLAEHVAILDALTARDGRKARELMVAHIAAWQEYFVRHFPGPAPAAPSPRRKRG